eukprot:NODE_14_length_51535_cov_1.125049.p18 type:complete len:352 gc:universal NODE_14_length_51535_cov_1.125049:23726-24781(+)
MEISKQFEFTRLVLEEAIYSENILSIQDALGKLRELAIHDSNAQFLMGELHEKGILESDTRKALKFYELSAKNGHTEAAYRAGLLYEFAKIVKAPKQALVFYRMAAAAGHGGACWKVGYAEMKGILGATINMRSSCKWMQLASSCATEQHPEGAYEYANMLEVGVDNIIYPDWDEALITYKKAADLNHPKALLFLAELYEHGNEQHQIKRDIKLAIEYYKKACKKGNTLACFTLSNYYLTGVESALSANESLAFNYMKMAARPFIVSEKLLNMEEDPTPNLKLLHSNNKKIPMSAYAIGYFYEMGVGCKVDREKFIAWYKVSYLYGDMRGASKLIQFNEPLPKKKELCKLM